MQVKRFKAADMRRALELVRSDLGEDAVILSSNNTKKGVEILATADDCQELLDSANTPEPIEQEKVNVFAKYEAEAEQESLAMLEDLSTPTSVPQADRPAETTASDKNSKVNDVDKSYLAEQLEKLTANISFPSKASPSQRGSKAKKPSVPKGTIEVVEDSDFSSTFQRVNKPEVTEEPKSSGNYFAQKTKSKPSLRVKDDQSQQQIELLQSELSDMRELLEMQLAQTRFANLRGMPLACDRRLEQMGFGLHFRSDFHSACDLAKHELHESAWENTIQYLTEQVKTLDCDLVNSGGQIAFIGPTGAGKTTTIAKLAARYVLKHGRESVAIVTLDNERLGSQDQLKALAKILQIPIRSVNDAKDLPETLASLDYCRLVLIDTPGVSSSGVHADPFVQQIFAMPDVTKLAVLACNVQRRFQKSLLEAMSDKNLRAVVLTKLDETDYLAETLDVVISEQLAIAYSTAGQHIPNDLSVASSEDLVQQAEQVLKKSHRDSASAVSADEFQKQSA